MQFIKSSLVVVVFSFLWACSSTPNQLRNFIWLQGTWVANKDKVVIIETWKMQNDSTMLGTGKVVAEGDTTIFEQLALKQQRNGLLYCVHLNNSADTLQFKFTSQQTDARAASFLFQSLNKTANRTFNTPHQIRYEQLLNDKMRVTIEYSTATNMKPELFEFTQIQ
jgi:hypothetical protein